MNHSLKIRVLSLVLAFVMIIGYLPINTFATESEPTEPSTVETEPSREATEPEVTEPSIETTESEDSIDVDAMSNTELLEYISALSDEELVAFEASLTESQIQRIQALLSIEAYSGDEQVATFQTVESTLASGITQTVNSGYGADGKLINYYVAIADINRDDVGIHTTYKDAQCEVGGMAKMTEQAASLQALHSNPEDEANYIPYYAIVAGVNGDGYDTGSGKPSGVHIANGVVGFGVDKTKNSSWFAIFEDGVALIGENDKDWDEAVAAHGPAQEAIGGFQLVRKDGVDWPYSDSSYLNDGRYPRSFVGITADNQVVFMVADGNGSGGSAGTNWHESVEIMDDYGCTYILCLDGGGSATYISRPEGSNDIQVTSDPSDGSERAVSNGLVMYTTTPPSNVFAHANVSAKNYYLAPGAQTSVSAVGVSPAGTAADIPENAVWEVTGGKLEDGVFIAETLGDATIALKVGEETVGSVTVHVVLPDAIDFGREAMTVPTGGTVVLKIDATYQDVYKVVTTDENFILEIDNEDVGTLDGWKFTAAESGSGVANITATFKGTEPAVTDTVQMRIGKASEVLFDFEEGNAGADLSNWKASDHGGYTVADLSIVTAESGMVHSGEQALAFHYPMDEALHGTEFWAGNSFLWDGDSVELKNVERIGFWLYIPEDATQFAYYMSVTTHGEDGNMNGRIGTSNECYNDNDIREYSGWHYVSMDVGGRDVYLENNADQIGKYFNGTQFKKKANCFFEFYAVNIGSWIKEETNYAGDFTFYIDDITVDYSDAVDDRENPIVSDMTYAVTGMSDAASLNGQTVSEKIVSFAAFVEEDMSNPDNASGLDGATAVAYIDGEAVACDYADGMITVSDVELTDGTHTIRMGICDEMGNYAEAKRQITVASGSNDASVRVKPQDEEQIYMLNDSVYWIDVEADNVENIDTVTMKLDLDSMNNWVQDQIDVLHGFTCSTYFETAAEQAENILTVRITRNDNYLAENGTAVLASLPIRIWEFVSGDDHKHPDAVAAWNCKYVCAPALSVDVDTEMGSVTYSNGSAHSFSSEDIHTLCVSYTYGLRMRDFNNEYYKSHSYHVHDAKAIDDKAATCTENGYTGRTWCDICASPVEWGTTVPATGHTFAITDGVLKCACGQTFTGIWTDGKEYTDGVTAADGWAGDSYYKDGKKVTGIQVIDGFYYDFGESGVCKNQIKLTGLFYDETVSAYRYAKIGELVGGWVQINDKWHYFDPTTKVAVTGDYYYASRGITYHFDETGMTEGVWQKTKEGTRYWYGQWYYQARGNYQTFFVEIDGKTYNFDKDGYMTVGIHALYDDWAYNMRGEMRVWEFDMNGVLVGQITTKGLIDNKRGGLYLVEEDGFVHGGNAHVASYNGNLYFVVHSGKLKQNATQEITDENSNGLLAAGTYYFGADGKLYNGIKAESDGYLYYYKNGQIAKRTYNGELVEFGGDIYLVQWSGKVTTSSTRDVTVTKTNGLLPAGTYYFGADGKATLPTGVIKGNDGLLYYYKDGKIQTKVYNSELVEINGDIYLVKWSGKVAADETRAISADKTNGLLAAGTYYFGADGKLFTGIKAESDGLYYYQNGKLVNRTYNSELVEINGDIYLVKWSGKVAVNETRKITADKTNGLLTAGTYYFGADGKLFTGVMAGADGILYYYQNGQLGNRKYNSELVKIDGAIYLVKWSGKVAVNETRAVTAAKANGLVEAGTYTFGADGKLQK